jgi:hypothetical protein
MTRPDLARRLAAVRRFFGGAPLAPAQRITLVELMNLDDRQLADIGLTRATARQAVIDRRAGLRGLDTGAAAA